MRRVAVAALLLAGGALWYVLAAGGGDYELRIRLANASQLVTGNRVTVGGREVGLVDDIALTADNRAEVTVKVSDDSLVPLHRGTTALVRAPSLAGVANRYVALDPGPNSAPALPSNGVLDVGHTRSTVELDELLNTFDAETRGALRGVVAGSAAQYRGAGREANAGLLRLNPALAELEATAHEVGSSSAQLEQFVVEASAAVSALDGRPADLQRGIDGTA